ncbi:uncharacterized protein BDV17DRAFT_255741 [Aspergillus undulatus]|uniref:uncharacterized protein n=1 Tax=Aspergillus undulatus TaxID=1810928 RepID=UPI003CCDAAE5
MLARRKPGWDWYRIGICDGRNRKEVYNIGENRNVCVREEERWEVAGRVYILRGEAESGGEGVDESDDERNVVVVLVDGTPHEASPPDGRLPRGASSVSQDNGWPGRVSSGPRAPAAILNLSCHVRDCSILVARMSLLMLVCIVLVVGTHHEALLLDG